MRNREFALVFRSVDDGEKNVDPINEVSVLPGGSIEVLVSFDSIGESSLTSSESLQVRASVDADSGVTLDPSDGIIHLSSVQTTVLMTVQASVGAIPTVVSLSLVDGQGIENADIQSGRLNVSIDRRLFNLSFDPTSLILAAGSLEAIELRISGADLSDGERVAVDLTVLGNANVAVIVPVAFGDEPTQVVFIAPDTLTAVVNIDASEAMTVGSALVVAAVSVEGQQALGAEIELAQLAVTIEIVERELAIAFNPIEVRLNDAGTARATLTLEGLLSDEQVRVNLNQLPEIPSVEIYDVVADPELVNGLSNVALTSASPSVLLELRSVGLGQPIALTASIDDAQAQALNAQVTSGVLQVLPQTQAGRVFSLAFDPDALTLTTGESRTFAVLLNGPDLLEGERVTAAVTVESDATIVVSDNPLEDSDEVNAVEFTNSVRRMNVTITAGQMPESLLLVAVVSDETRESVSDAQFSPATLQVLIEEVIDDRTFSLVFNPTSVTLTAGETAQVNISLVGAQLNIDESVEVTLASVGGGEGVMITPSSIVLTNLSSSATFEIAPQIGAQAQSLSIIASGAGVNVAVASLPVTIQLREFILGFDPASIELTVGTSADVNLLLEGGSLNIGEQLRVMLIGGAGIDVTPGQVIFAGGGPNMMPIQVSGVSVDLLGLGAEARAVANSDDAQTLSAQFTRPRLPVTVTPRSIGVRFDRAMVEIVRGGSAKASGSAEVYVETDVALLEGEAIEVSVFPHTASNLRADPGVVTLTAASSRVMVTLIGDEAAQSGVVTLVYLEGSQGLNNNIEVNTSEGRLQVEVVRGVNIAFDPADELRIEANTPASVIVRTSVDLIEDEQVTVQLGVTGSGLSIVSNSGPITLNALMSTTVVEVSAVIAGAVGDLTATATGEGVAVLTQVATLPVRVLRGVSLVFEIGTGEVVRGSSTALSVTTEPLLITGEVVTARLTVGSATGLSFDGANTYETEIRLDSDQPSQMLELFATATAPIGAAVLGGEVADRENVVVNLPLPLVSITVIEGQFRLVFDPPAVSLLAGGNEPQVVRLILEGIDGATLPQDDVVSVVLEAADGISVMPLSIEFTGEEMSTNISLLAEASAELGDSVLTATGMSVAGVDIASGELSVTINAPPREFELVFSPSLITIRAGDELSLEISIQSEEGSILLPSEEVVVDFSYNGAAVMPVEGVVLSADNLSATLSLELPIDAMSGNLLASASLVGANIADGAVAVTIEPRAFALVFNPSLITIRAGDELSLEISIQSEEGSILLPSEEVVVVFCIQRCCGYASGRSGFECG